MTRRRILRLVSLRSATGAYGGPADTSLNQARLAVEAGFSVKLVSAVLREDQPVDLDEEGIEDIQIPSRVWVPRLGFLSLFSFGMITSLKTHVKSSDIVHVSFAREPLPLLATLFALKHRKKLILQPHGMLTASRGLRHKLFDLLVKPLYSRASAIIALTQVETRALSLWHPTARVPVYEVGNPPLPVEDLSMLQSGMYPREAIFIGRLEKRKRVNDFVRAGVISSQRPQPVKYVVLGPDQGELGIIAPDVATHQNITYEGSVPMSEVPARLSQAAVFVLPSLEEPWGNVLVTSICLGIPVVVTRSAALAGIIEDYRAGIIVGDGDPDAIEEAVRVLVDDLERREQAVRGAKELAEVYLSGKVIRSKLEQLYMDPLPT